jgi:hypothetical protein
VASGARRDAGVPVIKVLTGSVVQSDDAGGDGFTASASDDRSLRDGRKIPLPWLKGPRV